MLIAAGDGQCAPVVMAQVRVLQNLLGDGRDACAAFEHLYFFGDLNYRLGSAELPDKVTAALTASRLPPC